MFANIDLGRHLAGLVSIVIAATCLFAAAGPAITVAVS